jgi:hypothetical protein
MLQRALAINKVLKVKRCLTVCVLCQAIDQAKAAKTNIVVQIIPNAQSGGFQSGCFKFKYHGPISVNIPPLKDTTKIHAPAAQICRCEKKVLIAML